MKIAAPLLVAMTLLLASPAHAEDSYSLSERVVVTATLTPEEQSRVGSAATVITRQRIEESGAITVLEVLRSVPGLDVVRSGADGAVTSVFLRGANSNQALVLVDGVRVNSPYFGGYDFSALTTENVERIEVVRGPFSALYGSDALGGVIQIFTRAPGARPGLEATLDGGNDGWRQGSVFASSGVGPVGFSGSFRHVQLAGERPNSQWQQDNGSVRVDGRLGPNASGALEASLLDGEAGNPGPVGVPPSAARGGFHEQRVAVPIAIQLAQAHQASLLLAHVLSKPSYDDPVSRFSSDTRAQTLQLRGSDTWRTGRHAVTILGSWEQWLVDATESSAGVERRVLDGARTTLWGAGLQDSFSVGERWSVTAGLRYDRHSEFGSALTPRATISWLAPSLKWKIRSSAGTAYRAPSLGELYYPFGGNTGLSPERSMSFETGVERYLESGRAEASVFWNEFRDLIVVVFDPATMTLTNQNVGRARTRGVELGFDRRLSGALSLGIGYTYLDARDQETGKELVRRPKHRAFLEAALRPARRLLLTARGSFVGQRADIDAITYKPTVDPAYARFDVFGQYDLGRVAPYLRLDNLTDRRYEEADGYPASRRRIMAGVAVKL